MSRLASLARGLAASSVVAGLLSGTVDAQLYEVRPMKNDPALRGLRTRPAASSPSSSATDPLAGDTRINMEVFTGKEGVGYRAQQWQAAFDRAGIMARIRSSMAGDKIALHERQLGRLREVTAVGRLQRDGSLVFPGHRFGKGDVAAFDEWIRELRTYGAQGNPTGKSLWGLTQDQFDALFRALARPVEQEVAELGFDQAVDALHLPARYAFRLTPAAESVLAEPGVKHRTPRIQLAGFAQGTALAMLLSQYGLAFRPNRTPSGSIELLAVPLDEASGSQVWPIGWDAPEGSYPAAVAPSLFRQTKVELKDQKLTDVLEAIGDKTATPVRIDLARIESRGGRGGAGSAGGLNLDSVTVSASGEHMAWAQLLMKITAPSYLTPKIRTDEARKPFVWITVLKNAPPPAPARLSRPSRIKRESGAGARERIPDTTPDN